MAYQPKSYRKFVATAATATLVAGAVAPLASAASFTDVAPKYKEAVDFVVSKGIKGFSETQFGVNENIKRADAAVMLVKVLGLDTEKAPASGFTDVPARAAKEVNALKAAGITSGKTATQFGAHDLITRGELAVWIQKGFELKGSSDVKFTDVAKQYKEAVSALVDNGITNGINATQFGTDQNAKRGDFAIFLLRANEAVTPATVESVSAINEKTLQLKGTGLKNLKAENVTVAGVPVTGITPAADGKSATVTLGADLTPGVDYKVTVKTEKETKEFTVKYTFEVTSAAITTTTVDANKEGQKLALSVNGVPADVDYLVNADGWKVEFQADKDVFKSPGNVISATGEIDPAKVKINDTFTVKAVLTKAGVTVDTPLVKVTVTEDITPAIGSLVLTNSTQGVTMNSTTLVTGESATVAGVYSNTGDTIGISGERTYASSNVGVVQVDATTGAIKAVAPGKATITVTAGKVTYTTEITVTNEARKASKATPVKSSIALAPNTVVDVDVNVFDQYGDPIKAGTAGITATSELFEEQQDLTVVAGKTGLTTVKIPVVADTKAGVYTVYVKNGVTNIGQFNVSVSADNVGNTPKLELKDGSQSSSVDVLNTTILHANLYTETGGYVETLAAKAVVNNGATADLVAANGDDYKIEVADSTIASLTTTASGKDITVTAKDKIGSTDIVLKKGTQQVAKFTVSVTNNGVKVTAVDWKAKNNTITNKGVKVTVEDALNIEKVSSGDPIVNGLTLSKETTSKVRIQEAGFGYPTAYIYLDKNDDGSLQEEEKLGIVAVSLTGQEGGLTLGTLGNLATTAQGHKGTFVFTFEDTVSTPAAVLSSTTLNVDVK